MTAPGLCGDCQHARTVTTRRGSTFYRCARAERDARYPRYPRLPVQRCPGYEPRAPAGPEPGRPEGPGSGAGPASATGGQEGGPP